MNKKLLFIFVNLMVFQTGILTIQALKPRHIEIQEPIVIERKDPKPFNISIDVPGYLNYDSTVDQLKKWNQEAKEITEVGIYGKSSKGNDLYYFRMKREGKPRVLITACIHGNEPLSSAVVMGFMGTILSQYNRDPEITRLMNERDLYFIPVASPDTYPHSRHVDGVDPNRNFPTLQSPSRQSVPPVEALKQFFLKIKPNAVISGHTHGRIYLIPYGDQTQLCPHHGEYQRIIGKMSQLSGYGMIRACQNYGRPIYGTEVDWYYRNGSFSIVMEFGRHQRVPSMPEVKEELIKTFKALLLFCEESPLVIH